jgi:hypothetical protein
MDGQNSMAGPAGSMLSGLKGKNRLRYTIIHYLFQADKEKDGDDPKRQGQQVKAYY